MTYGQEAITPYGEKGEKSALVERMFNNIAPTYDRLNHRLSWQIDRSWRRQALRPLLAPCAAALARGEEYSVLDIATGTGDLAILAAQTLLPTRIVAADIAEQMMDIGRQKVAAAGLGNIIHFAHEDALALSFPSSSFSACTAAFGIRNFAALDKGLSEICRVLKKNAIFTAVETTTPVSFPLRQLFHLYSTTVLPRWGQHIAGDRGAYEYLSATIAAFPQGEQMREVLMKAGFSAVHYRRLTGGICTHYIAIK